MSHPPETDPTRAQIDELVTQTPASGRRRSVAFVAVVATLGSLLFGYDTGVIAGALPYMYMPHAAGGLGINSFEEGLVGGILLIGCAFGAFFGGRLSDRYGRRHNILLLAVVFFVGAMACTFSPNLRALYPARFVLGFAVGGASATVPVYLAETAPKRIRGTLVGVDQLMIVTGQFLAFAMNAIIARGITGGPEARVSTVDPGTSVTINGVRTTIEAGQCYTWDALQQVADAVTIDGGNGNTWRYMLVICSIPAIALWIGMRMMPESSRWYAVNRRIPEAIGVLKRVRDESKDDSIADEVSEMIEVNRREAAITKWGLGQVFRTPWTRRVLVIGCFIGIFNQTTGVNTMMYYAPKVLQAAGFATEDAIVLDVLTGLASVIGSALGLWLLARFSRRRVIIGGTIGLTVMLWAMTAVFLLGINPHLDDSGNVTSGMPPLVPYLVVIVIVVFMLFMQASNAPGTWVIMSELFPARMRGAAMGFAVLCIWISNAIITFAFPSMMSRLGPVATYLVFALINVVAVVYMYRKVPETKYASLEELEEQFQQRYA